jgi:recombination protein RecT
MTQETQVTTQEPQSPIKSMYSFFESKRDMIIKGLTSDISPDKFMATCYNLLLINPDIAKCDKITVLNAVNRSAQMGLSPDPIRGEAYFIPRKNACTFQIGYKGLIKMAIASGAIKMIQCFAVHENEHLIMRAGEKPDYIISRGDRGELEGFLCLAKLNETDWDFEYMTVAEINRIRDNFKATDGVWAKNYNEMAKKTVIKRLLKRIPNVDCYDDSDGMVNITPENQESDNKPRFKSLDIIEQTQEQTPERPLTDIQADIKNCQTSDELTALYKANVNHSLVTKIIQSCTERKAEILLTQQADYDAETGEIIDADTQQPQPTTDGRIF